MIATTISASSGSVYNVFSSDKLTGIQLTITRLHERQYDYGEDFVANVKESSVMPDKIAFDDNEPIKVKDWLTYAAEDSRAPIAVSFKVDDSEYTWKTRTTDEPGITLFCTEYSEAPIAVLHRSADTKMPELILDEKFGAVESKILVSCILVMHHLRVRLRGWQLTSGNMMVGW